MNLIDLIEQQVKNLRAENAKLRAENNALKTHAPYGILTRAAFEIERRKITGGQWVIFGDIDRMHEANTQYGYEAVNTKIQNALKVRSDDLLLTGLWFSGDEIVFIITGSNPQGFCNHIQQLFIDQGMSITVAFSDVIENDIGEAIAYAADTVQRRKANRK